MKRLGLALALWAAFSCAALAQVGGLSFPGPGPGHSAGGSAYVGPLDVAPTAVVAYCLRACSNAKIGSNVIDIKRASDGITNTFVSLTDGSLDMASIATFLTATTGQVTKWYDQSGNNNHLIPQTGSPTPPAFTASATGLGTNKPALTFDGTTSGQKLVTTSTITIAAQPFFMSAVTVRRGGTTGFTQVLGVDGGTAGLLYASSANNMVVFAGSAPNFAVTDGTFHAIGALFSGGSSQGYVNGTGGGIISAGTATYSAQTLQISVFGAGTPLNGDISEVILWASNQSGNAAGLSTNQHGTTGYNFP